MGMPVLILGKSGSGKSASLRNFRPDEVGVLNVASKPLPFRNGADFKVINVSSYDVICKLLSKNNLKTYVIDDSQYLMAFDSFEKANVKGYDKFTAMAVNFYKLLQFIIKGTPKDTIVYLLNHTEENDSGEIKMKTIGKMLDQQLTVEGLFTVVLMTIIKDGGYYFLTRSDGHSPVKTPMGMFEDEKIANDLKMVDTVIREYFRLNNKNTDETNKEDA